jgi:hypothetical protein
MHASSSSYYKSPRGAPSHNTWINSYSRRYDIIYKGFLFNHLTHNLVVLGSTENTARITLDPTDATVSTNSTHVFPDLHDRFAWWVHTYKSSGLDPPRSPTDLVITEDNWQDHVSTTNYLNEKYPEFLVYFDQEVAALGIEMSVKKYVPFVSRGLSGSALHPVIHLGLGIESGNSLMVAEGLACLCSLNRRVAAPEPDPLFAFVSPSTANVGPEEINTMFAATVQYIATAVENNFYDKTVRFKETVSKSGLGEFQRKMLTFNDPAQDVGSALNDLMPLQQKSVIKNSDAPSLLPTVNEAMAIMTAAYLASDCEFFVIHGITCLHSTIVTMQLLNEVDQQNMLVHWWRTAMAALTVLDFPNRELLTELLQQWKSLCEPESIDPAAVSFGHRDGEFKLRSISDLASQVSLVESHQRQQPTPAEAFEHPGGGELPPVVPPIAAGSTPQSVSALTDDDIWWSLILRLSLWSEDEHGSKAVYCMWRWSHFDGVPPASKVLFKLAAQNQIKPNLERKVNKEGDKSGDKQSSGEEYIPNPNDNIWFF